ncbi:MAG: hypothetical protein INR71_03435, partial [Terriglobus roseus]|nr:hypothetical protein [Terriglobus roseus]
MAQSFAGFASFVDGGDTQPLESQVYRQFTSSAVQPSTAERNEHVHVDLYTEWDGAGAQRREALSEDEPEGDVSDISDDEAGDRRAASASFNLPKTPALGGRRRDGDKAMRPSDAKSEAGTSSTKTPGSELVAAMFGAGHADAGNLISLTQAFNQTQAPSSPLPNAPKSDHIFERPSPNFRHAQQRTSPLPVTSSPPRDPHSEFSRATSVPLEPYRTVQESQEERARRRREEEAQHREKRRVSVDSDDDLFAEDAAAEQKAKRKREHQRSRSDVLNRLGTTFAPTPKPQGASKRIRLSAAANAASSEPNVQIPMTSSRPNASGRQLDNISSTPSKVVGRASGEVPATASQSNPSAPAGSKDGHPTAIEDSQKEKSDSQKENDDPAPLSAVVWRDEPLDADRQRVPQSTASTAPSQARRLLIASSGQADRASSLPPSHERGNDEEAPPGSIHMTSSPPLLPVDHSEDRYADESDTGEHETHQPAAGSRRSMRMHSQATPTHHAQTSAEQQQAQESTPLSQAQPVTAVTNTTSTGYHTAASHQTPVTSELTNTQNSTKSFQAAPSTRTRKLTDIAADSTPRPSQQLDLGSLNVMTADDERFVRALSGSSPVMPARKKRVIYSVKQQRKPAQSAPTDVSLAEGATAMPQGHGSIAQSEEVLPTAAAVARQGSTNAAPPDSTKLKLSGKKARKSQHRGAGSASRTARAPSPAGFRDLYEVPDDVVPNDVVPGVSAPEHEAESVEPIDPAGRKMLRAERTKLRRLARDIEPIVEQPELSPPPDHIDEPWSDELSARAKIRVFALCRDLKRNYWAADFKSVDPHSRMTIVFDDGTTDTLEAQHVRKLELRPGDVVKVDMPAMKKKDYVVQAADMRTVTVTEKNPGGRGSFAKAAPSSTPVPVRISQVYLTGALWPQFHDRPFTYNPPPAVAARLSTPLLGPGLAADVTPSSRSRRAIASTAKQEHAREASIASARPESSLLANMAFAVSFKDDSSPERKSTLRLLSENGAAILDAGFEALFTIPPFDTDSQPTKGQTGPLRVTHEAHDLGFVALITDQHSRRPKFLQALALGLPCLHHRWVRDCVAAEQVLPWEKYLLPAGESTWL